MARAVALSVVAMGLMGAGVVQARAVLVSSEPAEGAVLSEPPREVVLRYSEEVEPRMATVSLLDGEGRIVRGTRLEGRGPRDLVLVLPELPRASGEYYVKATVASKKDFQLTDTLYKFRVEVPGGAATGAAGREGEGERRAAAGARAGRRPLAPSLLLAVAIAGAVGVALAMSARRKGGPARRA